MRDETIAHRSDLRENQHAARGLAPMTLLRARYSANGLEGLASQLALTSAALFRRASSWALAALSSGLGLLGAVGGGDGTAGPGLHPPARVSSRRARLCLAQCCGSRPVSARSSCGHGPGT
jgi:hypothetical protein